jgi:4-hydroxy-2-oxoheptanedioate aldolase
MNGTTDMSRSKRAIETGIWITTPSHWAVEIAKSIGYDAILIDLEHGTVTPESADGMIALGRSLGLKILVRVASPDRVPIQQALDSGADAIILPQVLDLEHARTGSAYAKYPKLGLRGMGSPRSLFYGDTPADFVESENKRTRCLVMIETPGALAQVDEIAALPTVDGLFMGPYDLSLTRGRGQYSASEADLADARSIASAAKRAKKFLGMPAGNPAAVAFAKSAGADFISLGEDLSALNVGLRYMFEAAARA